MDVPALPVSVLGAGAWGTALAIHAARRHPVRLWARDAAQAQAIQAARRNERYLPDVELPASLDVTADFESALRFAEGGLLVIATPMAGLRATLSALRGDTPVLWLCKGFEAGTGALGHEIAAEVAPARASGVLSGPSFALEVAQGLPTALVAASSHAAVRERALQVFHAGSLRVYASTDPVGVEVGGAVKNVLAIATGICDGMGLGMNARAALVTRGLAEMARLGAALGARPETFMGLSGLGDLVLTATGSLSRNRKVGLKLAEGLPLARILAELGHVAEGVACAPVVRARAASLGVEMPLAFAVDAVLRGELTPTQALGRLLEREARAES